MSAKINIKFKSVLQAMNTARKDYQKNGDPCSAKIEACEAFVNFHASPDDPHLRILREQGHLFQPAGSGHTYIRL